MARAPSLSQQERKWRAQEALATLMRAKEIQSDRQLVADAKKLATEQARALSSVSGRKK